MLKRIKLGLILFGIMGLLMVTTNNAQEIVHEWVRIEYDWQSPQQKAQYIVDNKFIPENNVIAGIKIYPKTGDIYVTVPRWRSGVPSTLNKVVLNDKGQPVLQPYPSWEMQTIGEASALQYVQSMVIDSRGWMWILDVGRRNFFESKEATVNTYGKLVIWDIDNNCLIREFVFPDFVSSTNDSFLNDIVLDETAGYAYMPETYGNGGIVIYDFNKNIAKRWNSVTLTGNPNNLINVNGINYPVTSPSDGIALTHDTEHLYYCSLSRQELYSVPTYLLKNFSLTDQQIDTGVVNHGVKGYSDGMTFSSNGLLYFGSIAENAVYQWNPTFPISAKQLLFQNSQTNQWQDTFAFDGKGSLYWVSNRLQDYIVGTLDFYGTDPNFRIWKVFVNGTTYLTGNPIPKSAPCVVKG